MLFQVFFFSAILAATPKLIIDSAELHGDLKAKSGRRTQLRLTIDKAMKFELRADALYPVRVNRTMGAILFRGHRTLHFFDLPDKIRIEAGDALVFYYPRLPPDAEIKSIRQLLGLPAIKGAVVLRFICPLSFIDSISVERLEQIERFSIFIVAGCVTLILLLFLCSLNLWDSDASQETILNPPAVSHQTLLECITWISMLRNENGLIGQCASNQSCVLFHEDPGLLLLDEILPQRNQ